MRTQDEVVQRIASNADPLGFQREALVPYLDFEHAKPMLKDTVGPGNWQQWPLTQERVLHEMRDYMQFAWNKVIDHRGISASRSVEKMSAWTWLLGDDDTVAEIERAGYAQYGAPKLAVVCRAFGFSIPEMPTVANMIAGEFCKPGCEDGCGL